MDKYRIDKTVNELYHELGVRKPFPVADFYRETSVSTSRGNRLILSHLGIRNKVSIKFVPKSLLPNHCARVILPDKLTVYHLMFPLKIEIHEGHLWGNPLARWIPITVQIDQRYCHDVYALGAILAHEDTHLYLKLLQYRVDEVATDIATLLLGLGQLVTNGRNRFMGISGASGVIETLGYLDDESFRYASAMVSKLFGTPYFIRPVEPKG